MHLNHHPLVSNHLSIIMTHSTPSEDARHRAIGVYMRGTMFVRPGGRVAEKSAAPKARATSILDT